MQDITPPEDEPVQPDIDSEPHMAPERSIRNIKPTAARVRMTRAAPERIQREAYPRPARRGGRWGVWAAAIVSVIVLGGAGALVMFPSTSVTVTPHVQVVPFDASTSFTAVPEATAAPGMIAYTVITQVFEDSAVVAASGVEHVDEKATGQVTVYNSFSDKPVRLIKNTRFQAPNGLIFRIPASVDVPGKKGTTPGTIQVTVFADQTGETYNLAATDRFTLPGLKSTPDMYAGVYAKSITAFTGGFSGDRPAVSAGTLDSSRSEVRGRLNEKAQQLASTAPEGSLAFPGLISTSFETLPPTNEPGGGVRIHERATVVMPVFPAGPFSQAIAQAVSANAEGQTISIKFSDTFSASASSTLAQGEMGQKPFTFKLSGSGQLIWNVDPKALAQALAGRDESAFQTLIQGFPAVEEARARITPFWKHSFPSDPSKISISVEQPEQPF
ncbi:hypothetical protein A2765_00850 [Candidatus Kaiserbacteria bacterium RIFCSPHIGHO2_01_FULL_56_24]|uniref:Baseplate protein J-like domain-containing protein n=1 Tax=Candidatus Kaiserbacteria bacterium RIFCSPHIGHO2_01_FULL_56_24 TaxID=1798487 RepID=A0A1F6DEY8_9BACT|nr:MAG: hypothetical protein A2765_00850 [Candidatus Kaiserbacteria bacterium RIFCSPHIGHO2_01_FULL_56_24]